MQQVLAEPEDLWHSNSPLPIAKAEFALATYEDKIYLIGGFVESRGPTDSVEVYDPQQDSWKILAPLPVPLHHITASAYDGKIYVAGGTRDAVQSFFGLQFRETSRAEGFFFIYDIPSNEWFRGPDMPTPRLGLTSEVIDGIFYAVGGANHYPYFGPLADHEAYNLNEAFIIKSGKWETKSPMPTARDHLLSTVIDKKLYVLGGRQTTTKVTLDTNEVYDPITDSWKVLKPMLTPRGGFAVAGLNGTIFAFGGLDEKPNNLAVVEQYIPGVGWKNYTDMPFPLQGFRATTVDNTIYVLGGVSNNHLTRTNLSLNDPNMA